MSKVTVVGAGNVGATCANVLALSLIHICSNSTSISAKWEVRNNMSMNHMTPTGIKGLDLYCLQDGKWIFAGTA